MSLVRPGDRLQQRTVRLDGSGDHWARTTSGLVVPTEVAPALPLDLPVAVDLFCGAGGMSIGFHQAGFEVAAACENDLASMVTYLTNLGGPNTLVVPLEDLIVRKGRPFRPGSYRAGEPLLCADVMTNPGDGWISAARDHAPGSCASQLADPESKHWFCDMYHSDPVHRNPCRVFFFGDVRRLNGSMVLRALARDDVDAVVGGPPCQGYSKASGKSPAERRHDPRNLLVFEFARLVLETHAKAMVMENVPQILTMLTPEGVPVIDALCRVLADGGFSTYDAVRRSLLANADVGGALRRDAPTSERDSADTPAEPVELTLFDEAVR